MFRGGNSHQSMPGLGPWASRIGALLVVLVSLGGCGGAAGMTVLGAGAGAAAGVGANYTLNGIAYKTFTASSEDVHTATLITLKRMGMFIKEDKATERGFQLHAQAVERDIHIELERVTTRTTRMRVSVDKGDIFKDRATAAEIITQSAYTLDRQVARR